MRKFAVVATTMRTQGILPGLAGAMADAGVDVRGFMIEGAEARFLVDDGTAAWTALQRAGHDAEVTQVFEIRLDNRPAALARVAAALGDAGFTTQEFGPGAQETRSVYLEIAAHEHAARTLARIPGVRIPD